MSLAPGTRLGPYEILAPIGAGGMGEVYRARDTRLGRDVAVKVLSQGFAGDPDRRTRFEREAKAIAALSHPNILAIFDVGAHDGQMYVVTELLEGESLRDRLNAGAVPVRKAVEIAVQIARGLAAAHDRAIVHRDLKPENVFLLNDGQIKILDFGLARHTPTGTGATETIAAATDPGTVMGTVGYMAPEQVRGEVVDARTDLFALGAVLYELLSGHRAFRRATAAETMTAILHDDPPDLGGSRPDLPPALDRIVRHCFEKKPAERFETARDVAFALEALSGSAISRSGIGTDLRAVPPRRRLRAVLTIAGCTAGVVVAFWTGLSVARSHTSSPSFHRLSFRRGLIHSGRFAPDGQTVLYSASWNGSHDAMYTTRPENPESRPLGYENADVLAISPTGEIAVAVEPTHRGGYIHGTLARVGLAGSALRPLLEHVAAADWGHSGRDLAVVHVVDGKYRLEFPIGTVLYETEKRIVGVRLSPDGRRIAFSEGSEVAMIDADGRKKTLSSGWAAGSAVVWSPHGDEVWFSASELEAQSGTTGLFAVTLDGRRRTLARGPMGVNLLDVSADGRALVGTVTSTKGILSGAVGSSLERDLSWLDWGLVADVSSDGAMLLFSEGGIGGGVGRSAYIRRIDGSPAVRLGEGTAQALSPDGTKALALNSVGGVVRLVLLPIGTGAPQVLTDDRLSCTAAHWLPDGRRVLLVGRAPGERLRSYVLDTTNGALRVVAPEGVEGGRVSPDGDWFFGAISGQPYALYSVANGERRAVAGLAAGDEPVAWSTDGRSVYVRRDFQRDDPDAVPVFRVDMQTGKRELWHRFVQSEGARIADLLPIAMTRDGRSYAYTYVRGQGDLYLIEGLK